MIPAILFPYFINFAGITYLIPSVLLTLYYCYICYELMNFKKNKFILKIILDLGNPWIEKIIFDFTLEIKNPKIVNIGTNPKI